MNREPVTERSVTDPQPLPANAPAQSTAKLFLSIAILGVTVAAAIVLWITRVYQPQQANIADALASSDRAYTGLGAELQVLRQQFAESRAKTDGDAERLSTLEANLATVASRVPAPNASLETNLKLTEVAHLVAITNAALRFERDLTRAVAALEAAQAVLADTTDTAYDALESALASDRAALLAVTQPDTAALAAQWVELADTVESLTWRQLASRVETGSETDRQTPMAGWQGVLVAIWHDLRDLVQVSDLAAEQTLLDPSHEPAVKSALRAELALLRLAAYQRDTANVKVSGERARQLLANFADDPALARLQHALEEITALDLAPTLPALTATFAALEYLRDAVGQAARASVPEPAS